MEEQVISYNSFKTVLNKFTGDYKICLFILYLGVGKSKTIEAMAKWAELILLKEDHEVFKPRVLILAFTGKAASLIGKNIVVKTISYYFTLLSFQ